jgi:hypothetical protein
MDIKIKIGEKSRLAYIPKALHAVLGNNVRVTPDRCAVLLFAENTSMDDVLKSLEIIKSDLLHAKEMQEKKEA